MYSTAVSRFSVVEEGETNRPLGGPDLLASSDCPQFGEMMEIKNDCLVG